MRPSVRRRLDWFLVPLGALVVGAIATIGALAGDTERIGAYWTHAHINADGSSLVVEVIDYDFGSNRKRGLLRQIPDVDTSTPFDVSSPTAPDQVEVRPWWVGTELRVGDPDTTISNRHRYEILYVHDGLVEGTTAAWNAVGDGWAVPVHDIEVHLTADRTFVDPRCDTGRLGDTGGCNIDVLAPGHILVHHDTIEPGQFLTVRAQLGDPVETTFPAAPTGPAPDPGLGWLTPGWIGALSALVAAAALSIVYRRLGREWVWDGGSVDAAFGPSALLDTARLDTDVVDAGQEVPTRKADHRELVDMTTIEFEAPRDLSAALGGVVHVEKVLNDHKTAWLLEAAIRDEIELDTDGDDPTIRRGDATPNPAVAEVLDTMFGGRQSISLDKYSKKFAKGWDKLGTELERWHETGGMWDERGRRRHTGAIALGIVAFIAGGALLVLSAVFTNRSGSGWIVPLVIGAAIAGAGLASLIRAWELRIRTPEGSGAWIRIESFRRFLHESEADHVERAAEMGLLRQYTAWAVALGEVDRWENAVDAAVRQPGSAAAGVPRHHINFIHIAPLLASSVSTASTAPSSSGGSGGFSGGAGGGGGGGGGGSW